jgi:Glycosyltransferase family 9 (heptosyltransferase)
MSRFIDSCAEKLTKISYSVVPHSADSFLKTHSRLKLAKKYLHRYLPLRLSGQLKREIRRIEKGMRVLWLYTGKANFGDAIMDLSGRSLLRNAGVGIDLLTLPKLCPLFLEDDIFENVYSGIDEIRDRGYDALVLNEFNYPSIDLKITHFGKMPFACLFQYFYGPDRNQTLFSFAAVNDIFGIGHTDTKLCKLAKPYLHSSEATRRSIRSRIPDAPAIALAVGGIDDNRTYRHWPRLLASLDAAADDSLPRRVVLLGSDNGRQAADEIMHHSFKRLEVVSLVEQLSLLEAREVIGGSRLFVGCDGGLMHVAHSTETPSVTLFSHREPPHLRLTTRCQSVGIQSTDAVSAIAPETIARAITRQCAAARTTGEAVEAA